MGRGRSSGGGGFRSAPRAKTSAPKPATKSSAPPPAKSQNGGSSLIGTLGSAIADGIGWGVGSTIGHRAIDYVLGPRTTRVIYEPQSPQAAADTTASPAAAPLDSCSIHNQAFSDCINQNVSDIGRCQYYLDLLNQCRRDGGSAATMV